MFIYKDWIDQRLPRWGWRKDSTMKAMGEFWGDLSVLLLDCGGGYNNARICQNLKICTLKKVNFTLYKLCQNFL
jgi:hypothetical protein